MFWMKMEFVHGIVPEIVSVSNNVDTPCWGSRLPLFQAVCTFTFEMCSGDVAIAKKFGDTKKMFSF
jgi:hypothetical protein